MAGKKNTSEVEVLDDDFNIGDVGELGDDIDENVRDFDAWKLQNVKTIGSSKVDKGKLYGKKMIQWDVIPRCDPAMSIRLETKVEDIQLMLENTLTQKALADLKRELKTAKEALEKFKSICEICELDEKGRCEYKDEHRSRITDPKCVPVDKMMKAFRSEVFLTYMDLDQDSYNKIGLELLPLYVLQCRLNLLITAQPIMHATTSGSKSSPLLKELRSTQQSIEAMRSQLDIKLEKIKNPGKTFVKKADPLRGE